ncbi:unnamed protein product [Prorocentrum cordatum]|uniref:Uncharacterized protein n=1 Tax=Prorocentrum cordatum TaxID=2364126 RepID=A0ABN9TZ08_9DINO|nr:unnamed protein product [Polarella glacialis]
MANYGHLWSRRNCGRAEWDTTLLANSRQCPTCNRQFKLHKLKYGDDGDKSGVKGGKGKDTSNDGSSQVSLLRLTIQNTEDQQMKKTLQARFDQLPPPTASVLTDASHAAAEAVRRAVSVWRDADHKRSQEVGNVVRLQQALTTAQEKAAAAGLVLAQAARAKTQAMAAMAAAEGLAPAAAAGRPGAASPKFELKEAERTDVRKLQADLTALPALLSTKESEVNSMLSTAAEVRAAVQNRMAKKRRVVEGEAGNDEAAAPATAPAAAPTSGGADASSKGDGVSQAVDTEDDEKLREAAEKLTEDKREAPEKLLEEQKQNAAQPIGKGKGTQPPTTSKGEPGAGGAKPAKAAK